MSQDDQILEHLRSGATITPLASQIAQRELGLVS